MSLVPHASCSASSGVQSPAPVGLSIEGRGCSRYLCLSKTKNPAMSGE